MKTLKFSKACLVGVGLIGGSLSRDLLKKKIVKEVIGFDTDKTNLRYAVRQGIVSRAGKSLKSELVTADVVILATPVLTLENQIKELSPFIPDNALVLDVGSTKQKIMNLADRHFKKGNFVGCHPMAGSELSGAKASVHGLYEGAPCILVRGKTTKASFVLKAKKLWQALGGKVLELNVKDHDRYLAACSHLPHALSFVLMSAVGKRIPPGELQKIAGKSFKSYTRIAGSDPRMWTDIFLVNPKNTLAKIRAFKKDLELMERLIASQDEKGLFDYMEKAARMWRKM